MFFDTNTLLIHIGIGKTATTAIQEIGIDLYQNNPESLCILPFGLIANANNGFASNHPQFDRLKLDSLVNQTSEFIKKRGAPALLSSEFLIRQNPCDTEILLKMFIDSALNIKIMACIRNYASLMISSYLQAIKVNYGKLDNESLSEYIIREFKEVRYVNLLSNWSKVVGLENVILFDYDKYRNKFVEVFYGSIGVNVSGSLLAKRNINPSLPIGSIGIINEFDRVSCDNSARNTLINFLLGNIKFKTQSSAHFIEVARSLCDDIYNNDLRCLADTYTFFQPDNG